eukprot:TRINITY_DN25111_c0_g1_i1.p1 TRINITY_DN25111_c0_g1~~TRINITY_DN25111_c0_g1_i1.p1  ORF type:complete len:119 (+),score=7.90 TRINITY_DN25111_c0_g1_i1:85-441(+)
MTLELKNSSLLMKLLTSTYSIFFNLKVLNIKIERSSDNNVSQILQFISSCPSLNKLSLYLGSVPIESEAPSFQVWCPQSVEHLTLVLESEIETGTSKTLSIFFFATNKAQNLLHKKGK